MKKFFSALTLLVLLISVCVFFYSCKESDYAADSEVGAELIDSEGADGENTDICPGTDNENGWGRYETVE